MNDEIKEILDYFQKDVDKYEENKKYLMQKYGYDEETIDNISQHERHINTKKLLDYITNLQKENKKLLSENITIKSVRNVVDETIYKSRIEKAVEYIDRRDIDWGSEEHDYLLNILNGE